MLEQHIFHGASDDISKDQVLCVILLTALEIFGLVVDSRTGKIRREEALIAI